VLFIEVISGQETPEQQVAKRGANIKQSASNAVSRRWSITDEGNDCIVAFINLAPNPFIVKSADRSSRGSNRGKNQREAQQCQAPKGYAAKTN
jgi:hypothetical protein